MTDLFVEIFPVEADILPPLAAYHLHSEGEISQAQMRRSGNGLARRFRRAFSGVWWWADDRVLTDTERSPVELMITLDIAKGEKPETFAAVSGIDLDTGWQPSAQIQADYALRTPLKAMEAQMAEALSKLETRIGNARVEREHKLRAWSVDNQPAVSISIASRLIYNRTLQQFAGTERDVAKVNALLADLQVVDPLFGLRGAFSHIVGPLVDHRERLLDLAQNEQVQQLLNNALDGEWVVMVMAAGTEYEYLASMLNPMIRVADFARFEVDSQKAIQALQMTPATRAAHVKAVSDVTKEAGVLANAYNSRVTPELFFSADFEMNLRFDENRVRPYKPGKMAYDFSHCGVFRLREVFESAPMKVCVVNTLTHKLEDFVEALQRYLQRHFAFNIDIIRERQVRVVSRSNLESAIRVVEKENPDIILAFFPDEADPDDEAETDMEATASYVKSLTLGRGIPTHVIYQSTLDDPDSMAFIVLTMLGKTGSSPFVLAEPLEQADYVVGLDVVKNAIKGTDDTQLTAIARVYSSDGAFSHYVLRDVTVQDKALPYVLMRDLFPQRIFQKKRVVLHHDGVLDEDLLAALGTWGQAISAIFYPVEIVRFGAPRIYALEKGVVQPPWGSAFKLSNHEALLVSSLPKDNITPQPLHVRTIGLQQTPPLPIEAALRSILVWTLLAYGEERLPKLPVTTLNADQLAYWLGKGGAFNADEGQVPFWL